MVDLDKSGSRRARWTEQRRSPGNPWKSWSSRAPNLEGDARMPAHCPCGSARPARTALQAREGAVDPSLSLQMFNHTVRDQVDRAKPRVTGSWDRPAVNRDEPVCVKCKRTTRVTCNSPFKPAESRTF